MWNRRNNLKTLYMHSMAINQQRKGSHQERAFWPDQSTYKTLQKELDQRNGKKLYLNTQNLEKNSPLVATFSTQHEELSAACEWEYPSAKPTLRNGDYYIKNPKSGRTNLNNTLECKQKNNFVYMFLLFKIDMYLCITQLVFSFGISQTMSFSF